MDKTSDEKRLSKKLFFIAIGVLVLSSIGVVFLLRHKNTATVSAPTGPYTLVPADVTTAPGVAQRFTVTYSVSGGWQNISDASLYIGGRSNDQWVHYNPMTKNFTLMGAAGSCTAGEATTLSTNYLSLNCGATSASGSGEKPMITFSLTPQPSLSGTKYMLNTIVMDKSNRGGGGTGGNWTIK